MKIISWNINGFRSRMTGTLLDAFRTLDADIYCLQETKLSPGGGGVDMPGFRQYLNCADRPGYAGTALLTAPEPQEVVSGLGLEPFDGEGRLITADYGDFCLVNAYAPNAAPDLSRLPARVAWDAALLSHLRALDAQKPVILCGDLNAAYNEADLQGASQGMQSPGYTREEREGLTAILRSGFVDAHRALNPGERAGAFAYRRGIRAMGMDYFLVSERLMDRVAECRVHQRIRGSDHWPMELVLSEG